MPKMSVTPARLQGADQALRAGDLVSHRSVSSRCGDLLVLMKKPLGRLRTRGDASAGGADASGEYEERCTHGEDGSPCRPRMRYGGLSPRHAGGSVAPVPGGDARLVALRVGQHPERGRALVADERAAGVQRAADPALGGLRRHPDVEVPALPRRLAAARCAGTRSWASCRRGRPPPRRRRRRRSPSTRGPERRDLVAVGGVECRARAPRPGRVARVGPEVGGDAR